jgi:hypothetical protein
MYPPSATIATGQGIDLAATARDSSNKILLSSGFTFAWNSDENTVATVVSPSPAGAGVGTTTATGVAPGGPINITATSASSTEPGTASVTVNGGLVGTSWYGTYQWSASCTSCVQGPQSMTLDFTTSTMASASFDATQVGFSGTVTATTFTLTSPTNSNDETWNLTGTLSNGTVTGTVMESDSSGSATGTFTLSPEPPTTSDLFRITHD